MAGSSDSFVTGEQETQVIDTPQSELASLPTSLRVLIADDHPVIRAGLCSVLTRAGYTVVGEAADGHVALRLVDTLCPDLLVLDLTMPDVDGLAVLRALRAAPNPPWVLVLTDEVDDAVVVAAAQFGAQGYLPKHIQSDELIAALQLMQAGQVVLHPCIARVVMAALHEPRAAPTLLSTLTRREGAVLHLIAKGCSNSEIATHLTMSVRTAATHVRNILGKLQLTSRTQAALYAIRAGLPVT